MSLKDILFSLIYFHKEKLLFLIRMRGLEGKRAVSGPFGVNVAGYLSTESGVGEAARATVRTMLRTSVPLALNNVEQKWLRSEDLTYAGSFTRENPYAVNVLHVNADMVPYIANRLGPRWFRDRYNIGYWFWELEDFPSKWKSSFKCFDEIWVASEFCRESISRASPVPVTKMPPSIEVRMARSYPREHFGIGRESFVFLFVFDLMSDFGRKNPMAVIDAFGRAFRGMAEREVTLVLKLANAPKNRGAYDGMLRAARGLPVKVIDTYLERDELHGLVSVSDCYVSLHRSEGFGLPLAEAMCMGKPAIATGYSGNMEFMNEENSLLVRYDLRTIERGSGAYRKGCRWAEPDAAHAAELMRTVFEDRARARRIGEAAKRHIREHFSPEALKGPMQRALADVYESARKGII